jgi:sugar/nucleoside kinase (ribokinase family)
MGRCGVDFCPTEHGSLVDVEHFDKFLGGSPVNVAVATARLGQSSALISRTGPDPFDAYVHAALQGFHVDDRFVSTVEGLQTQVTFCETFPPDHFPIYFYRQPKAPDLEIYSDELDEVQVCVDTREPDQAADRLLELGCTLAVVKMGPEGVLAKTLDERVVAAPVDVEVVNGLGAGDGFGGALCHGILAQWPLAQIIDVANAAGAIVASRLACSAAMPTIDEIEELLEREHS